MFRLNIIQDPDVKLIRNALLMRMRSMYVPNIIIVPKIAHQLLLSAIMPRPIVLLSAQHSLFVSHQFSFCGKCWNGGPHSKKLY